MFEKNEDVMLVQTRLSELRTMFEDVIRQSSLTQPSLPEMIDIDEVCRITGYKKSTIYKLKHERKISCYEPQHGGRRNFFKRSEVYAWMQRTRISTREEAFQNHLEGVSKKHSKAVMTKQAEIEFLRQNLREAKAFLKLWQLINSLLLIKADKN